MTFKPDLILAEVLKAYGVSRQEILSVDRKKEIVAARRAICYLMREFTNLYDHEIAVYIDRDRSTVVHHHSTMAGYIRVNDDNKNKVIEIIENLQGFQSNKGSELILSFVDHLFNSGIHVPLHAVKSFLNENPHSLSNSNYKRKKSRECDFRNLR